MREDLFASNPRTVRPRPETPEVYDANQEINALIKEKFLKSVKEYDFEHAACVDFTCSVPDMILYDGVVNILTDEGVGKEGYGLGAYDGTGIGATTLLKQGTAVACFHQGLTLRGWHVPFMLLVMELSLKKYYEPGKGTYHNLFDHYGLRRATSCQEVIDAIAYGHMVTLLMDAAEVNGNKRGFVNLTGVVLNGDKGMAYIESPISDTATWELKATLDATEVAWIW